MSVKIIADSSADVAASYRPYVRQVPVVVRFGQEEYFDGITIDRHEFYEKLVSSKEFPSTSQASPAAFMEAYEEVTKQGDSAVVITISAKMSGTYQSACIAAEDYDNIYVVDSTNGSTAHGALVEYAVRLAQSGMDAKSIKEELDRKKEDLCVLALVDTLEYLQRGGRISKTAAIAGGLLNIKPVIGVVDGMLSVIGKARGSKKANNLLREKVEAWGGIDFSMPLLLGYTGNDDVQMRQYINDSSDMWVNEIGELDTTQVCSVVGAHAGPGAIVFGFFKKHQ